MTAEHEIDPETSLPIEVPVDDTPADAPVAEFIAGRYARLEPLAMRHASDLFAASSDAGAAARFRYLLDSQPASVVGNILLGPTIARTRVATEAIYLMARQCIDGWRYRRFEWKCDNLNAASCRAANRFGFVFEGVFRRDFIVKGRSRDTAWYSITDEDWPRVRDGFERWLDPPNSDEEDRQKLSLEAMRGDP